jgi:hypothetical protein
MKEREQRIGATGKGAMPRSSGASQPAGGTGMLLGQLRDLRMGRPPEGLTLAQRAALGRIEAALEVYRSVFYPPSPSPLWRTPFVGRVDEGRSMPRARRGPKS